MTASGQMGFAVVGLGNIAKSSILPAFRNSKNAKLVALVGRDKGEALKLARKFPGCAVYEPEEFAECVTHRAVGAVYISTPQASHLRYTQLAARAGKHVLCEKPLAATVQQSARMVRACRESGVQLMTAYRKCFEPSTIYLKQLISRGELGRIDTISTAFSELHIAGVSPTWMLDREQAGGGPLMDLGVYCVHTSRWMVDEDPAQVSAVSWQHDKKRFRSVEEGISFRMRFPSGLVVQGCSTYSGATSSFLFVQGAKGWVSLSPAFPFDEERIVTGKIGGKLFSKRFNVMDEFAPEIDAFAAAIREGRPVTPDGAQGHRDMCILDAIYQSARKRKPVVVKYS